jgi:DNA-binding NtrC family response regulator
MPGADGLTLITEVRRLRPETPLIMITGFGPAIGKQVTRLRAYAFVCEPITWEKIVAIVKRRFNEPI